MAPLAYSSLKLEDYPIDTSAPLKPTKFYYLLASNGFATSIQVIDLTADLPPTNFKGEVTRDLHKENSALCSANPVYHISKHSWISLGMQLRDAATDTPLADLHSTVLQYGLWKFTFPLGSPHSSHEIEMRPLSVGKRAHVLVKDSVPFVWELESAKVGKLYRIRDGKRRAVGGFAAEHGYSKTCTVGLDDSEGGLDCIVGLASVAALMNRVDSF
jgi:hypothetical protein